MDDLAKTKPQLIEELADVRRRLAEAEAALASAAQAPAAELKPEIAQRKLAEALDLNQTIIDAVSVGIAAYAEAGPCVLANPAMARVIGAELDQVRRQNFRQLASWQTMGLLAVAEATLRDGQSRRGEFHGPTSFGKEIWAECYFARLAIGGEPHLLLLATDVTAHKLAELALLEGDERARRQFRAIPAPIYSWHWAGDDFVLNEYNDAAYLFTKGEVVNQVGKTARDLGADNPVSQEALALCVRDRLTVEKETTYTLRATGEAKALIARYVFIPPDGVLVTMLDITERKKLEEELADANALLEAAFEQTPIPMMLASAPDQVLRIVNSAAQEFLEIEDEPGYEGRPLLEMAQTWQDFDAAGNAVPPAELPLALAFKEIIVRNREYRIRRKDGAERWALVSGTPVYNWVGQLIASFVAFPDITDRKQTEALLQASAAKLERSNRELQSFASSASHDLQEPLRKIQAFGDRLATKHGEQLGEEGRDYLRRMSSAAARMQAMIRALLDYSRVTTKAQPFAEVDLAQVAAEVVSDLEVRLEQTGGRVELGALPVLEADALQIHLLLQNLIANGLKFHRPEAPPVVRVWSRPLSPVQTQIMVADNGVGFDEKYLDRLFQPFQRLHGRSEFEGSGMGLAICRKIVERHGGAITAKSMPGQGATFIVALPNQHPKGDAPA